jgi:predicted nucleotidyltransferase
MQRERIIETIRSHAGELSRFDVQSLLLFGSVARDEAHERSDVDLLVSFRGAATFGHYMGLKLSHSPARHARLRHTGARIRHGHPRRGDLRR